MDKSWDNYEPAPLEYLHGEMEKLFWESVKYHGNNETKQVVMSGGMFHNIIGEAKTRTYEKYKKLGLKNPIRKTDL